MEVIFFIGIIIYVFIIISKNNVTISSTVVRNVLINKCELKNIQCKTNSKREMYYTGMKQGEEYMVLTKYNKSIIMESTILEIKKQMNIEHYHNCIILISNANNVQKSARKLAEENSIEIVEITSNSNNYINKTEKNIINNVSEPIKNKYESKYDVEENQDPIQSGTKTNSLLGNIFNNKIEKL